MNHVVYTKRKVQDRLLYNENCPALELDVMGRSTPSPASSPIARLGNAGLGRSGRTCTPSMNRHVVLINVIALQVHKQVVYEHLFKSDLFHDIS